MYAVIQTGGKQYKVSTGDVLKLERLPGEAGNTIAFDKVMMVGGGEQGLQIGAPLLESVTVEGQILEHKRGEKIIIFKKKRRHNYRRKIGHRQELTVVRITGIGGVSAAPAKPKKASKPKAKDGGEAEAATA